MTEIIPVLLSPSGRDLTRDFMVAQLAARSAEPWSTAPWSTSIPSQRPLRFFTIEELNSTTEYVFADAQMIQIRYYDTDRKQCGEVMRLIKALWQVLPASRDGVGRLLVQSTEHAGGPSYDEDPDIDGLYYGQVISWVTVMNVVA
jgi:hypothetical protein